MSLKSHSKVEQILLSSQDQAFKYGKYDCVIFSRRVLSAYHGKRLALPVKYDGSFGSIKANFRSLQAKTLVEAVESYCKLQGWSKLENLNFLQPYDLVILESNGRKVCGVWEGYSAISVGEIGSTVKLPISSVVAAYRVKGKS